VITDLQADGDILKVWLVT